MRFDFIIFVALLYQSTAKKDYSTVIIKINAILNARVTLIYAKVNEKFILVITCKRLSNFVENNITKK